MKSAFKIAVARLALSTGSARPRRSAGCRPGLGALVLLAGALLAAPATSRAQSVFWSQRDLLADFFKTSEHVGFVQIDLVAQPEQRQLLAARLGYTPARSKYVVYVATTSGKVDGYAVFDDELGQHLPITFAVKLSPSGLVVRQEIVAYREARGDEVRDGRFRAQFVGKSARDTLRAGDDIVAVSGATISSRAMAIGVRRAVVLVDTLVLAPQRQASASAHR